MHPAALTTPTALLMKLPTPSTHPTSPAGPRCLLPASPQHTAWAEESAAAADNQNDDGALHVVQAVAAFRHAA